MMKHKKVLMVVTLVLAMMFAFSVGISADEEGSSLDEVAVNIPALEQYMEFPTWQTVTITDRHEGCYYVADVTWDPFGDPYILPEKEYTAVVELEVIGKNYFDNNVKAYINDNAAQILSQSADHLKICYTFPALKVQRPSMYFDDVKVDDWFYSSVEFVYYTGLMNGVGNNKFDPHGTTTRGQIVTILYRMEGEPAILHPCPFDDVDTNMYYAVPITWAQENGIVSGYDANTFGPNDYITREQMAKIFCNYAKYRYFYSSDSQAGLTGFDDANKVSSWAMDEMEWAHGIGLINGTLIDGKSYLDPQGNAERCQAAAIFERFCKKYDVLQ